MATPIDPDGDYTLDEGSGYLAYSAATETLSDVVYLVDDDPLLQEEMLMALSEYGTKVVAFSSASECLAFTGKDAAACVISNSQLPDLSGLELQRRLAAKANPPIIFVSDQSDINFVVSAMNAGAIDFLTKPIDLPALISAVRTGLAQDRRLRQRKAELADLQARLGLLTPREREVLPLVIGGLLNKQAASVLCISEVTLQIHRSQVMRKMRAASLAELVRMALKLRIPHWCEHPRVAAKLQETPLSA
jgi:FixJ family two-component response regulator